MASPLALSSALDIEESARRAGAWSWTERRLYEVVGEWAVAGTEAPVKVYFDACSQHHAWRSALWSERLPGRLVQAYPGTAAPQAPAGLVGPVDERAEQVFSALAALSADVDRAAVYTRAVLARSAVAYLRWRSLSNPASDRPVRRVLDLVLADLRADWEEGTQLLVELMEATAGVQGAGGSSGGDALAGAAGAVAQVEGLMLGGTLGPGA